MESGAAAFSLAPPPAHGYPGHPMCLRIFAVAVLIAFASLLPGCKSPEKKEEEKAKKEKAAKPEIRDMSSDTNFQAFLGRLRTAVGKRDRQMLSSMLAPDFG